MPDIVPVLAGLYMPIISCFLHPLALAQSYAWYLLGLKAHSQLPAFYSTQAVRMQHALVSRR
jgi:hypothetical protein